MTFAFVLKRWALGDSKGTCCFLCLGFCVRTVCIGLWEIVKVGACLLCSGFCVMTMRIGCLFGVGTYTR